MKKASFKTFVCSFVFSLFMIFTINGVYFRTHPLKADKIIISNKNITLFFKKEPKRVGAAEIIPIKKIALTLPPKEISGLASAGLNTLTYEERSPEIKIASAEDVTTFPQKTTKLEAEEIPLDVQAGVQVRRKQDKVIIENFDKVIIAPSPVDDQEIFVRNNFDDVISISENPKKIINQPQKLILAHNANSSFSAAKAKSKFEINNKKQPEIEQTQKLSDEETEETETNLLIPILKDNANRKLAGEIQIIKSPEKNQVAMVGKNIPINSMASSKAEGNQGNHENPAPSDDGWETMAKKNDEENPWLIAKGTKHPKNNSVLEQEYYKQDVAEIKSVLAKNTNPQHKNGIKVADAGMVKNILIPIPESILNEKKIIPQLSSSQNDKSAEHEKETLTKEQEKQSDNIVKKAGEAETSLTTNQARISENKGLLKSITSIFSTTGNGKAETPTQEGVASKEDDDDNFFNTISGRTKKQTTSGKILPTEIRLSFQPNKAEISGQTLKWIQAFANKTLEDTTIGLEVRIDGTNSYALQQKRLNLLHNILTNKGVEYSKINTVFTTREPNSFIIRTIKINSNFNGNVENSNNKKQTYRQDW